MADANSIAPMPVMATYTPLSESKVGAAGDDPATYSDGKHQHPRMSSSTSTLLNASGVGVNDFSRTFATRPKPSFAQEPVGDDDTVTGPPCVFRVKSWIKTGGLFTGANIEGFMLSPPTGLAAVNVLGISVAIGGQNYITYGPAANVSVSVIMLPNSAV